MVKEVFRQLYSRTVSGEPSVAMVGLVYIQRRNTWKLRTIKRYTKSCQGDFRQKKIVDVMLNRRSSWYFMSDHATIHKISIDKRHPWVLMPMDLQPTPLVGAPRGPSRFANSPSRPPWPDSREHALICWLSRCDHIANGWVSMFSILVESSWCQHPGW